MNEGTYPRKAKKSFLTTECSWSNVGIDQYGFAVDSGTVLKYLNV